jgi:hypothetical protein
MAGKNGFDKWTDDFDRSKLEYALKGVVSIRSQPLKGLSEQQMIAEVRYWYEAHPQFQMGRSKDKCVTDLTHDGIGKQSVLRQIHDKIYGQARAGRPARAIR